MGEELAGLIAAFGLFGWIPIAVYFKHKIRLEEIRAHRNVTHGVDTSGIVQALQQLRGEVQELRDTTTKFDMSFDAALTRLESRVDEIDERAARARQPVEPPATARVHRG